MRIDKMLANMGFGTRKEVKMLLRKKRVTVNEKYVVDSSTHISPEDDLIKVDGKFVSYRKYIYIMLHKPKGYISATEDEREFTVIDLLPSYAKKFQPAPVGRLDKDTEGLLLLTNDGALNHYLTSPKNEIPKKYKAIIQGNVTDQHVKAFDAGVTLDDDYITKPAKLKIISNCQNPHIHITITEGKYHQVKRMFHAVDMEVLYLKRLEMGSLLLDDTLKKGKCRELTYEELTQLKQD